MCRCAADGCAVCAVCSAKAAELEALNVVKPMPRVRLHLSNHKQINNQEPERMALS